jgi:hypothetical protein
MLLKIITTTDGKFVGHLIDKDARPIALRADVLFTPDKVVKISDTMWRLSSSNYVIDAQE